MDRPLMKKLSIVLYVLLGISVVIGLAFYFGPVVEGTYDTKIEEPVITQSFLMWTYILVAIAVVGAIVFSIINIVKDAKSAKVGLIGLAGLVVVLLIGWAAASSDVLVDPNKFNITEGGAKLVGGGLIAMYVLGAVAFLGIVYTEISRAFK